MANHEPYSVYILECSDGTLYTGITSELDRRVAEHQAGTASKYTRARLPVRLVYSELVPDRGIALQREADLKQYTKEQKQQLINEK